MIKYDSNFNTLVHQGYPATTSEPSYGDSLYSRDISCSGFDGNTGVGIDDQNGDALSRTMVNEWVHKLSLTTYRVVNLPEGWTITFQQHPAGVQELVSIDIAEFNVNNTVLTRDQIYLAAELDIINETEQDILNDLAEWVAEQTQVVIGQAEVIWAQGL